MTIRKEKEIKGINIAKEEIKKFTDIMQEWSKPKKVKVEDMGIKNLAYEVRHNKRGYYAEFTHLCYPEHIDELDRYFRKDDQVLKFIMMRKNKLGSLSILILGLIYVTRCISSSFHFIIE